MNHAFLKLVLAALAIGGVGGLTPASAQILGVFRWQMQPYCNQVTFTVVQQGPSYLLTGSDNMCGAGAVAPATGTATPNPDGSIALGFSIVTPSGATAHVTATVDSASVSGAWADADGHTGTFVFNGTAPGGAPRPEPTRSTLITSAQLAASIFSGTGTATTVARSDHTHDDRYYTEAESAALVAAARAEVVEDIFGVPGDLTPENTVQQGMVTTSKAGRLLINFPANLLTYVCSPSARYYAFLIVDGTPIRNSVVEVPAAGATNLLVGVTPNLVPAGPHTISVAARCSGASWSLYTYIAQPRVSVVVLP